MFLPVNMRNFCKQYKGFLYNKCLYRVYLRNSCEGPISSKVAGCRCAILVEVGCFVSVFQGFCIFIILSVKYCFGVTPFSGFFTILKSLLILI